MNINTISEHAEGMSVSYSSVSRVMGGITYELPIISSLVLEPGIIYNGIGASAGQGKILLNYISAPILAKYTFKNTGFGVYAGPQISVLAKAYVKTGSPSVRVEMNNYFNVFEAAASFGITYGYTSKMPRLFAQYTQGFTNIAKRDAFGQSMGSNYTGNAYNKGFSFGLSFVFGK